MTKNRNMLLSFLLLQLFIPAHTVFADTGPKPTIEFTFKQELPAGHVQITSGTLYECQQLDCSDASRLEELGPQRFTCDLESCSATAYGFAPYHRLQIQFSDGKTRESNIFATAGMDSKYIVTVHADDLLVEAQNSMFPRITTILLLCFCVLVIGLLVLGLISFFLRRRPKN